MRRSNSHSLVAGLLLATHLVACTEWHVEQPPPQAYLETRHPTRVQVTRIDRSKVVLDHPSIVGDSLVGQWRGRHTAVAVTDVAGVAARRTSVVRSALLVGAAGLVIAGAVALNNMEFGFNWNGAN